MQSDTHISAVMTLAPITVNPEDSLKTIHELFLKHGFHHVPVVNHDVLVGIVSYADYLRVLSNLFDNEAEKHTSERLLNAMLAKDVMSTNIMSLKPDDTIDDALNLFEINQFHAIPIVDASGNLLGMVTTYDIVLLFRKVLLQSHF